MLSDVIMSEEVDLGDSNNDVWVVSIDSSFRAAYKKHIVFLNQFILFKANTQTHH